MGGHTDNKSRFLKSTLFSVLHQGITLASALVLVPYMLALMGAELYGIWLILKLFSMGGIVPIGDLGFQGALIRFLARHAADGDRDRFLSMFSTGTLLLTVLGALAGLSVFLFAEFGFFLVFDIPGGYQEEVRASLHVLAVSLVFGFVSMALKSFYSGLQDFKRLKLWESCDRLLFTVIAMMLVVRSTNLLYLVILEQAVALILFICFIPGVGVKRADLFRLSARSISRKSLRELGGLGIQVFLNRLTWFVYQNVPDMLVASFLGAYHLTWYNLISRIPKAMKMVQSALNSAVPALAASLEESSGGDPVRKSLVLKGARYQLLLFVPGMVVLMAFAPQVLRFWIGDEYAFLGNQMRAYVLWQFVAIVTMFGASTFTRGEDYSRSLLVNVLANILFLVVAVGGILEYQLWAILAALNLSGAVTLGITLHVMQRSAGFGWGEFFRQVVRGPVLGAGGGLMVVGFLAAGAFESGRRIEALVLVMAAAAGYGLYLLKLGFRSEDLRMIGGTLWRKGRPG